MSVNQHIPSKRVWLTRAAQMADATGRGAPQCPYQIITTEHSRPGNRNRNLGYGHCRVREILFHLCIPARLTSDDRKFPGAHVTGTDISPIQPSWVAPNIEFIVEDFETEWQYKPNHFDFIHARCLAGYVPATGPLSHETL